MQTIITIILILIFIPFILQWLMTVIMLWWLVLAGIMWLLEAIYKWLKNLFSKK